MRLIYYFFYLLKFVFLLINHLKKYSDKSYYKIKYGINTGFICGSNVDIYGSGIIDVGSSSYIGNNSSIQISDGFFVIIGNNVSISHNVRIYTSGRNTKMYYCSNNKAIAKYKYGNVEIGDNVWIGANVVITHNVKICSNVVIGANSIVVSDISSSGVYGGVPIRKLK